MAAPTPVTPAAPLPSGAGLEAYLDATAAVLALPISPAHRPGVLHYLQLVQGMAALVMAHPLGVADEPAPAFVPVSPPAAPGEAA
jgi:hypothetical protein